MRALPGALLGLLLAVPLVLAPAAGAQELRLPAPAGRDVSDLLDDVGARPDRVLRSIVPGPVRNDEIVRVSLGGGGEVERVQVEQRLLLTGEGDYQVRERGPAREARALGAEPPPVTKFGAVVWQGFSPGERTLAALLTLDPVLEAPRLPLAVELTYTAPGAAPVALGAQGDVPGPGTVTVRLTERTAQPTTVPTAQDAPAAVLAQALDSARQAARATDARRLPTAGQGLPLSLTAQAPARRDASQSVPLRVTGLLQAPGATVTGPGTTAVPGGARLTGTLSAGAVEFVVTVPGATRLGLDLKAVPTLDARTLVPPGGADTWAAWAATAPDASARRAALDLLVDVAATGARAAAYSPYLGADLPGGGSTVFRWGFSPAPEVKAVAAALQPQPRALAAAALALTLLLGLGVGLWRVS